MEEEDKRSYGGSELHRLKTMRDDYDPEMFNRLYKICKPVIKRLSSQIDISRFNVSRDIIESYFWDKMLFVFNKYYGTCSEEHLKADILASLSTFKCKLLRYAYTEQAEWNMQLNSFEDLYDDDKGIIDDDEDSKIKENQSRMLWKFMEEHLSSDALLVFEIIINPPPFIRDQLYSDTSRITNIQLLDFFDMARTTESVKYIREIRNDIDYWIAKARRLVHKQRRNQRRIRQGKKPL